MQHWPTYTIVFCVENFSFPKKNKSTISEWKNWILTATLEFVREIRLPKSVLDSKNYEELKELVGGGEEVCRKK